ncbi:hypothetical protein [Mycobacterium sp.]|uniref:hypothetical protein n=1 Tax=Mycobacterium sp. TaxID=1785 RepID=UPI003F986D83
MDTAHRSSGRKTSPTYLSAPSRCRLTRWPASGNFRGGSVTAAVFAWSRTWRSAGQVDEPAADDFVVIDEKDLNHGEPFEVDVAAIDDEQRAAADDVTIPLQRRVTLPAKLIH